MQAPIPAGILLRERRRLALYKAIVRRLEENPELWEVPMKNLDRWDSQSEPPHNTAEWREILTTRSREEIIKMLLSRSQQGETWRKSSPFVGIISEAERKTIYERYRRKE